MSKPTELKKALKDSYKETFEELQPPMETETPPKKATTPKPIKQPPSHSYKLILAEASPQLSHFEARIEQAVATLDQYAEAAKLQIKEPYAEFYKTQLAFIQDQRTLLEKLQIFATTLHKHLTEQALYVSNLDSEIATLRADLTDLKDNFNLFANKTLEIETARFELEKEFYKKVDEEIKRERKLYG